MSCQTSRFQRAQQMFLFCFADEAAGSSHLGPLLAVSATSIFICGIHSSLTCQSWPLAVISSNSSTTPGGCGGIPPCWDGASRSIRPAVPPLHPVKATECPRCRPHKDTQGLELGQWLSPGTHRRETFKVLWWPLACGPGPGPGSALHPRGGNGLP